MYEYIDMPLSFSLKVHIFQQVKLSVMCVDVCSVFVMLGWQDVVPACVCV